MTNAARDRNSIAQEPSVSAGTIGLGVAAFEADPDPRFLFPHLGLQRVAAELLAFDLSERPGLLLITGAAGTGKSILLRRILEERRLGEDCRLVSCAGGPSFEALVEAWCEAFRIAPKARAHKTRLDALTMHLAARNKRAGTTALLLDDAEALDDHALKGLCDLAGAGAADRRLVRTVLAARPELAARLAGPELAALRPAIAFETSLEPMSETEVEAYIRHRLTVAGCETPDELFSAPAVEIVARASLGVPRVVNVLCRTALAIAKAGGLATVSAEQIEAAIQACILHAQDSLAAQKVLPLPTIPAAGAETAATTMADSPGPPRPEPRWPMVVELDERSEEASGRVARARQWSRRLFRSAPGLLFGLLVGLAVVTLYPARLRMPDAVPPGLLLSEDDEKAQLIEAGPAAPVSKPPADTRGPEVEPAVLELEPWIGTPAIEPEPVALGHEPALETQTPGLKPAPGTLEKVQPPLAEPSVLDREPWIGTPEIEAEPAPDPTADRRAPEEQPASLRSPPPVETRTGESARVAPPLEEPVDAKTLEVKPVVLAPKPPRKPSLLVQRDKPAAAAPKPEASQTEAKQEPTSWLDRLVDRFRSTESDGDARYLERNPDR